MSTELSSYKLTVPFELSEEEKRKEKRLQMMKIIFENDHFSKNSESLLEDIKKTQQMKEKKDTKTLPRNKVVITEMANLNK